jgi:hypothetical protein
MFKAIFTPAWVVHTVVCVTDTSTSRIYWVRGFLTGALVGIDARHFEVVG